MTQLLNYQQKIYAEYFNSTFSVSNDFTIDEYKSNFLNYQVNYGKILPENKESKILDIGCGCGHFLYFLQQKDYRNFLGIDVSSQQIEYCKKNITDKVLCTNIFEFLADNDTLYDFIIANDFIEHLKKKEIIPFVQLVYNSLMHQGIIVIKTPNMENPFSIYSRYCDFTHEVGFTSKSLYQVLKTCKFENVNILPAKINSNGRPRRIIQNIVNRMLTKILRRLMLIQGFVDPIISSLNLIAFAEKKSEE